MLAESGAMEGISQFGLIRSRRLWPLTLAQSCGALNDNLVKNAMIVLAIFKLGIGGAGLSALAGALFIAPYILLSASAGKLADRFAKPRLVVIYKIAEIALMVGGGVALSCPPACRRCWPCWLALAFRRRCSGR